MLSVVCRELNNKRVKLGEPKITPGLLEGSQEQVLADFYERSMADLPSEVRFFIEDHLLTVSGFRDSVALENALNTPGVSRQALDQLVERRLVRREDRGGVQRLELTHDVLTGVIRASRDSRLQKEGAEKERRQQRRLRKLVSAFAVAALVFLSLAIRLVHGQLGIAPTRRAIVRVRGSSQFSRTRRSRIVKLSRFASTENERAMSYSSGLS